MRVTRASHVRRNLVPVFAFAVAAVSGIAAGTLVLWLVGAPLVPVSQCPSPSQQPPVTRVHLKCSPYYFPIDPRAPNPGRPDLTGFPRTPDLPGFSVSNRSFWQADVQWLSRVLSGRATVLLTRPDSHPTAQGPTGVTWSARNTGTLQMGEVASSSGKSLEAAVPSDNETTSDIPAVVVEFPAETSLSIARRQVSEALEELRAIRWEEVARASKHVAQFLQQGTQICNRWNEEAKQALHQYLAARETIWTQLASLANERAARSVSETPPPDAARLLAQRQFLLEKRERLLATRTPEHPEVKQVEAALAEVEAELRLRDRGTREALGSAKSGVQWPSDWMTLPDKQPVGSNPAPSSGGLSPDDLSALALPGESPMKNLAASLMRVQDLLEETERTSERFVSHWELVQSQTSESLESWATAQRALAVALGWQIVPDLCEETQPTVVSQRPFRLVWWHFLAAFLVCLLTGEAAYSLVTGIAERRTINSEDELGAITGCPVFSIAVPDIPSAVFTKTHGPHDMDKQAPHMGAAQTTRSISD